MQRGTPLKWLNFIIKITRRGELCKKSGGGDRRAGGREGAQVEWRAGGKGAREEGAGGGGREGAADGREGGRGGWGRGGRRKFYLRVELIKCIDPNEGEALKRRGREGRGAGGREGGKGGGI